MAGLVPAISFLDTPREMIGMPGTQAGHDGVVCVDISASRRISSQLNPLVLAKAGTQSFCRNAMLPRWIPACAGMSGEASFI
jgi:hypothetical protein